MRRMRIIIMPLAFTLTGAPVFGSPLIEPVVVDWVQMYQFNQSAHTYDILLACWERQWPNGVKADENAAPEHLATAADIEAATSSTLVNCQLELAVRRDQILIDLARQGLVPPQTEERADRKLIDEIREFFDEYWSRL